MKLTGKCEEDFEKWCLSNDNINEDYYVESYTKFTEYRCIDFEELPKSMQYGVYVDFFDSVGLELVVHRSKTKYVSSVYYLIKPHLQEDEEVKCNKKGYSDRQQAREQAILKANEIYNESK